MFTVTESVIYLATIFAIEAILRLSIRYTYTHPIWTRIKVKDDIDMSTAIAEHPELPYIFWLILTLTLTTPRKAALVTIAILAIISQSGAISYVVVVIFVTDMLVRGYLWPPTSNTSPSHRQRTKSKRKHR